MAIYDGVFDAAVFIIHGSSESHVLDSDILQNLAAFEFEGV